MDRQDAAGAEPEGLAGFEAAVLPHLDDAYALARYLTRDDYDAQDVVQEAFLRALRHFGGYRGGDARVWLLTIVRHTAFTWIRRSSRHRSVSLELVETVATPPGQGAEASLYQSESRRRIEGALSELPVESREVVVLRDMHDLSYREIALTIGIPVGTVMSRLARARGRLRAILGSREEA